MILPEGEQGSLRGEKGRRVSAGARAVGKYFQSSICSALEWQGSSQGTASQPETQGEDTGEAFLTSLEVRKLRHDGGLVGVWPHIPPQHPGSSCGKGLAAGDPHAGDSRWSRG